MIASAIIIGHELTIIVLDMHWPQANTRSVSCNCHCPRCWYTCACVCKRVCAHVCLPPKACSDVWYREFSCVRYNTGKSALPYIILYVQCTRHSVPEDNYIYIRQSTSACIISDINHFHPNLKTTALLLYMGCGFWLWVLVMMSVLWFYLESYHSK